MATWRLSSEVQVAQERDGTILLNLRDGTFYSVTPVGSLVLEALREGKALSAVIDDLEQAYGQPRARLESDALSFIHDLVRKGLCHAHDE